MKKIKSIALGTILLIVAIILTILVLSNSISAQEPNGKENLEIDNISSNKLQSTYQLAWFVYNHSDEFLATSVTDIFKLNQITNDKGYKGLHVWNNEANKYHLSDIYFPGTMCIFHSQGSDAGGYKVKISNIVDIEIPEPPQIQEPYGNITVYKYNSQTNKDGETGWKTGYYKVENSDEKNRLSAFAYLASKITGEDYTTPTGLSGSRSCDTPSEAGMGYLWERSHESGRGRDQ